VSVAAHHLHLDTLPTLPSLPTGHAQWASIELASALVVAKARSRQPRWYGMGVWYGTVTLFL